MSYQPDFSGCWAKIGRAKEHRDTLEGEVGTISGERAKVPLGNRIDVSLRFDHQSGDHVVRTKEALPEERLRRWGLITGDVVHNLRGALDHLVWQLALFYCRGDEPENPRQVQFPLTNERPHSKTLPEDFAKDRALQHVCPDHRAIIEQYQPYNGPITYGNFAVHPFSWLQKFSNEDKHRVVVPALAIFFRTHINTTEIFGEEATITNFCHAGFREILEPSTETARFKVVPSTIQRNMEVAGYHTPGICFPYSGSAPDGQSEEPVLSLLPLVSAIDLMSGHVEKVIREFETLSY